MTCDKRVNVPIQEAAQRMGVTPQFLRMGLRAGRFPFGTAVQMPGGRWSYHIVRTRFEKYIQAADMDVSQPLAGVYEFGTFPIGSQFSRR